MSGMGILGAALLGGAKGAGEGLAYMGKSQMDDESAMRRDEAAQRLREQYALQAEQRAIELAERKRSEMAGRMQERVSSQRVSLARPMVETAEGTQQLDRLMPVTNSEAQMSAHEQALMEYRNDEAAQHKAIGLLDSEEQKRAAELEKVIAEGKKVKSGTWVPFQGGGINNVTGETVRGFDTTANVNQHGSGGGGGSGGSSKTKLPAGAKPYGDGYYLEVATSGLIEGPDGKPLKSKKKEFYTADGRPTTASVLLGNQAQSSAGKTSGTIPSGAIAVDRQGNPLFPAKKGEKGAKQINGVWMKR